MNNENRFNGLDILKSICAYMVVFIHCCGETIFEQYTSSVFRIAVPIFFMITGFFYKKTIEDGKEIIQIKKIIKLIVFSNLFYLAFYFIRLSLNGTFGVWFTDIVDSHSLIDILIFNVDPILHRLWYLNALLYCLIIAYFINKAQKMDLLVKISPILIIIGLLLGSYSMVVFDKTLPEQYCRNFITIALPFFAIGYEVNKKQYKCNNTKLVVFSIISLFLNIVEIYLLKKIGKFSGCEMFVFTPALAICVFLLFLDIKVNLSKLLSSIGKKHSTNIYIFHKFIEIYVIIIINHIPMLKPVTSLIVYIGSIVFSIMFNKIRSLIIK